MESRLHFALPWRSQAITGQGLTALAILVGLLWACVIGERVIVRRATARNHASAARDAAVADPHPRAAGHRTRALR